MRFLDFIWQGLFLSGVSASLFLFVMLGIFLVVKNSSARQIKWYFNTQVSFLLLILGGGFAVALGNHDLISGCFDAFVKQNSTFMVTRLLAGIWLTGFTGLLTLDVARIFLMHRKAKTFRPLEDEQTQLLFQVLKTRIGIGAEVQLYSTPEAHSPFVYGLFRYRIVIPEKLLREDVLRSALAHELAHVRDRDSLWLTLELFCRRILFWHPLAYRLSRLFSAVVEKAADECAVERGSIPAGDFLRAILEITTLCKSSVASPLQLSASRGFRETKDRMEALVKKPARVWSLPLFAVFVAIPLVVSIAEARSLTGGSERANEIYDPKMCMQVTHEKIIESWLKIETAPNKCEK